MKASSLLFAALVAGLPLASAAVIEEGTGIDYGADHVFSFTAPQGWMLDTESTPKTRVHCAFYPKGSTWKNSKVVAYATARAKAPTRQNTAELVAETLKTIQADDSPKAQVRFVEKVQNGQGKELSVYIFFGDKNSSFQAVAYAEETKTINALVYTSQEEKAFRDSYPAFLELVKSYVFIADDYSPEALNAAREKAEKKRAEAKK